MSKIKRKNIQDITYNRFYDEFIRRCKINNLSIYTIKFYENSLKPFKNFLDSNNIILIKQIDGDAYDDYVLHLQTILDNNTTIHTYLRAVKAFLRFAMKNEYIDEFNIKLIKLDKKNKPTYSIDDIKKLLKKPQLKGCSFVEYRNWIMVQYLLETGNRVNTLINLKVKDVDLDSGVVLIKNTKSHKEMYSPLSKSMVSVLVKYINEWGLEENDWLFPNSHRKQLSRNATSKSVAEYNNSRGVNMTSLHAFRHTFAKNYVISGGSAFKLQRLLGHSTLDITQEYVNLFNTDLKQDFERFSIIEKMSGGSKIRRSF